MNASAISVKNWLMLSAFGPALFGACAVREIRDVLLRPPSRLWNGPSVLRPKRTLFYFHSPNVPFVGYFLIGPFSLQIVHDASQGFHEVQEHGL